MPTEHKDERVIAYGSIGHNARATNFIFPDKETGVYFDLAVQELKKLISKMYPNWVTINIEIKEEES